MVKCFTGFPSRVKKSKPVCVSVCRGEKCYCKFKNDYQQNHTLFSILLFSPLNSLGNSFIMALKYISF